jgi:hypothetical protein
MSGVLGHRTILPLVVLGLAWLGSPAASDSVPAPDQTNAGETADAEKLYAFEDSESRKAANVWLRRHGISRNPETENLAYYYFDTEDAVGEIPSSAVTALAILYYLNTGNVFEADDLGRALFRCRASSDSTEFVAGAFSHALVRNGETWVPSDHYYSGENLLILDALLALHEKTGDPSYLQAGVGIGDWLLRVPYRGHTFGALTEDLGAPIHFVTTDGAFENTIRPHLLLLWLPALEQLSQVTGQDEYRLAMERTLAFLEGGISDNGFIFSVYDPGYPPGPFSQDNWRWHEGEKIIADELLLSAMGLFRNDRVEEARWILRRVRKISGDVYAYLDPADGGAKFVGEGSRYYDVVASCLVEKLALALGDESYSRSAAAFLRVTQSRNGGWYWGLASGDLQPLEPKQATLINLWAGDPDVPGFLTGQQRAVVRMDDAVERGRE